MGTKADVAQSGSATDKAKSMTVSSLLLPVFVQVGLTFVLMTWIAVSRGRVLQSGAVRAEAIAGRILIAEAP